MLLQRHTAQTSRIIPMNGNLILLFEMKKCFQYVFIILFIVNVKVLRAQFYFDKDSNKLICDSLDLSSFMQSKTDFVKYTDSLLRQYKKAPIKTLNKLTSYSHKDLINKNIEISYFISIVYPYSKEKYKKHFYNLIEKTGTEYWTTPSPECFIYALYEKKYLDMNLVELENLYQLIAIYTMFRWSSSNISYEKFFIRKIKNRITDLSGGWYIKDH
jgi:hypothetical protein